MQDSISLQNIKGDIVAFRKPKSHLIQELSYYRPNITNTRQI